MTAPTVARRPHAPAAVAAAVVAATVGLYFVNPNTTHVPLCPLHAVTGLNCPLCGGTRAVYALLHGQFGVALHDNLLVVVGIPFLALYWLRRRKVEPGTRVLSPVAVWTIVAIGVIFGVARNLPIGSWLAPAA